MPRFCETAELVGRVEQLQSALAQAALALLFLASKGAVPPEAAAVVRRLESAPAV